MMISDSLWFDHDLDLDLQNYSSRNIIFNGNLRAEKRLVPGRNGRLYSIHSIGMPLIWAPLFGVAYKISEMIPDKSLSLSCD